MRLRQLSEHILREEWVEGLVAFVFIFVDMGVISNIIKTVKITRLIKRIDLLKH
jgi:hypothetical protein